MKNWGRKKFDRISERWPLDEKGQPVSPVLFRHVAGSELDVEMAANLLEAYGIPVLRKPAGDGALGQVVLGFSGAGVDLMIPETMLEDARNISEGDAEYEPEELK